MPIATNSRTRFKKLSYKAPVVVHRGNLQQSTQQVEVEGIDENEAPNLGVDLSEVTEHHLQAALSSTQLANEGDKSIIAKPAYHIPTPHSKQILPQTEYAVLYPSGSYQDPVTYVRTSSTVEDHIRGASYNLDEDDQEWLEQRNQKAQNAAAAALKELKPPTIAKMLHGKVDKGREQQSQPQLQALLAEENIEYRQITEDEMEMVMTVFEHITSERMPFAHLDPDKKLPSIDELLTPFDDASSMAAQMALPELPPLPWESANLSPDIKQSDKQWSPSNPWHNLAALRPIAQCVYLWWKERREDVEGKSIVPQLNFDESNDADPYVCFRRREVKLHRKTRKTDVLHLEKLVKLRQEMETAVAMLEAVAQRERTKRASLAQDRIAWETVKDLQDIKRVWAIVGPANGQEDEDLISGEKREEAGYGVGAAPKKRKRVDEAATSQTPSVLAGAKLSSKKPRTSTEPGSAIAATSTAANAVRTLGQAIMERAGAVQSYIERECLRKEEADRVFEEGSDTAYQPVPAPANVRNFRPVQTDIIEHRNLHPQTKSRSGRPPSFRRRMGRGGRIFLDRKLPAPSPVPTRLALWPSAQNFQAGLTPKAQPTVAEHFQDNVPSSQSAPSSARQPSLGSTTSDFAGPFTFSANIRPSQLDSSSPPDANASRTPFAIASASQSALSDTASTSSDSTEHSKSSEESARSATTMATDVEDEINAPANDESHKDLHRSTDDSSDEDSDSDSDDDASFDRRQAVRSRWRYDDESGRWAGLGLCGLGGMEDDEEAVLDDFDPKFMKYRMSLLEEDDLHKLSTDWANIMSAQLTLDCPPPPQQVSVIGPSLSGQAQTGPTMGARPAAMDLTSGATSPPAAAGVPPASSPLAQAQAQAAQAQAAQQYRQQQAAAMAAVSAAGGHALNGAVPIMPPNVPSPLGGLASPATPAAVAARAAQTNVGGPLSALHQQQQIHHAQVQMALQQRQAAAAAAAAQSQAQAQGRASPTMQANRARLMTASAGGQPHPLSQSHSFNGGNRPNSGGSPRPISAQQQQQGAVGGYAMVNQGSQPGLQQQAHQQQRFNYPNQMQGPSAGSSPQMASALAAAGNGRVSSSSPAPGPNGASPMMAHQMQPGQQVQPGAQGGFTQTRSPSMGGQQQQQQQRVFPQQQPSQQQQALPFNFTQLQQLQQLQQQMGSNGPSLAQLQQQLIALQQQQQQQANGNGGAQGQQPFAQANGSGLNQPTAQALAMKTALMNSQNMQLKMPPNRVMQANGHNQHLQQAQQAQQQQQQQQRSQPIQRQPSQGSMSKG